MTKQEYERKLAEVDRLLNDPEASWDPAEVWSLLADMAQMRCHEQNSAFGVDGATDVGARVRTRARRSWRASESSTAK
jgi:hypothetical protein